MYIIYICPINLSPLQFWYKEPWTIDPFIFVVLLGLFWGGALYFYFSAVTSWQVSCQKHQNRFLFDFQLNLHFLFQKTPAESRQLNKDCILLDFYDNHDIWHFLSASAMFCTFMVRYNSTVHRTSCLCIVSARTYKGIQHAGSGGPCILQNK